MPREILKLCGLKINVKYQSYKTMENNIFNNFLKHDSR
jgi:hypothetical protein